MQVQPYLFFNGRCQEAADFYCSQLGAVVTEKMLFREMPASEGYTVAPEMANKILHMSLQIGDTTVMMSDGMSDEAAKFEGFSLALGVANDAEAERFFGLLADGGNVKMPMSPTFWSSRFGVVEDRFGVSWMVVVQ
ncbi:MAG TPA: VOC family protein [Abditibacteriaceae bacterium]|jgi:PhnB protein